MPYERSHGRQCIATGCSYTEKDRYFLLNTKCAHQQLRKDCGCVTVFKFHKFPINPVVRKVWVENVNRKDVNEENCRKRTFVVCSNHFPDGAPTKENPYPTLYLKEPCPNPKFLEELDYDAISKAQKQETLVKDVQHVVSKLCDILCVDEERIEEFSQHLDNSVNASPGLDASEDSLSARRHRRTIKKTFKAATFEKEKLFNRIRFGRPENRSHLLSLLSKTIDIPEVKECSVKLLKVDVDSTVTLSEWKDYSLHCKNTSLDFDIKIDSDGSYTEETPNIDNVVIKTEEDYGTLPELEFEIDDDYSVKELRESFTRSPEHESAIDDDDDDEDFLVPPPKKVRIVASPENGQKNSMTLSTNPKINSPVKVQFKPAVNKPIPIKKPAYLSVSEYSKLVNPQKVVKFRSINTAKISESSKVGPAQIAARPHGYVTTPKVSSANKIGKVPATISSSTNLLSKNVNVENGKRRINPPIKNGSVKGLSANLKVIQSTSGVVQPFKVSHSKQRGSVKHSANVKVIRTYSNEKELLNRNRKDNCQVPVRAKQLKPQESEKASMSACSAEGELSRQNASKAIPKTVATAKKPPAISKIWTELHTHYDYTEEEEVPFSELPEIDELSSYVVYEGEESEFSDDDDEEEEEEEEVESEISLTETLTEEKCFSFTGLSLLVFKGLLGILKECAPKFCSTVNLAVSDQMLLALIKLKMGFINADLSEKFDIPPATCGKIFSQWLNVMYKTLGHMIVWKSRDTVIQELSELFEEHSSFASCLIDVGQIYVQLPPKQTTVGQPDGKGSSTVKKFLYAVSPDGFVMFLSRLFEGEVSEARMFADCGIMKKLGSGDVVFVNRVFTDGITLPPDITFEVPPHTESESEKEPLGVLSKKAVDRLKIFRILRGVVTVPLSSASHIIHTCAALSNLGLIR